METLDIYKEEGEEIISCSSKENDQEFDEIVGQIEDIIVGEVFEKLQKSFMDKHYHHFDDNEENKLEYMDIFQEYQSVLEKHIEKELQDRLPLFSMETFIKELMSRKNCLEGEVFEVLLTFSDFLEFKSLMVDYKKSKALCLDLSSGIVVTSLSSMRIKDKES